MNADKDALFWRDTELFFKIVRTTPDYREAEDMLRRAKRAVNEVIHKEKFKEGEVTLSDLLGRLNDELHYVNRVVDDLQWGRVIKEKLGIHVFEELVAYKNMIYREGGNPT